MARERVLVNEYFSKAGKFFKRGKEWVKQGFLVNQAGAPGIYGPGNSGYGDNDNFYRDSGPGFIQILKRDF